MYAFFKKIVAHTIAFTLAFSPVLVSCGLQDITDVLEAPILRTLIQDGLGNDASIRYFDFQLSPQTLISSDFLGTAVYYKIYNSETTLQAESNAIRNSETATSINGTGFNALNSYRYQPLNLNDQKSFYMVNTAGDSSRLKIRFYDESYDSVQGGYIYHAGIEGHASLATAKPLRNVNTKGFNFYRPAADGTLVDPMPTQSDADVGFTSGGQTAVWYVNAFAVSAAQDVNTFISIYSRIVYLGYIQIKQEF